MTGAAATISQTDALERLERAISDALGTARAVTPELLTHPSPCRDWDLRLGFACRTQAQNRHKTHLACPASTRPSFALPSDEELEHVGQASYVRGLAERRQAFFGSGDQAGSLKHSESSCDDLVGARKVRILERRAQRHRRKRSTDPEYWGI